MRPSLLSIDAPRSRRQALALRSPAARLSLHIDKVVLDGFQRVDSAQVCDALTQSLSTAFQGTASPQFDRDVNLKKAGGSHDLRAGADARQIGAQIGKTLRQALQAAGRNAAQPTASAAKQGHFTQSKERR